MITYLEPKEIPTKKSPIYFANVEVLIQGKRKSEKIIEVIPGIVCKGRNKNEVIQSIKKRVKIGSGTKKKNYTVKNVVLLKQLGFGVLENQN